MTVAPHIAAVFEELAKVVQEPNSAAYMVTATYDAKHDQCNTKGVFLYDTKGDTETAIRVLMHIAEAIPQQIARTFKDDSDCEDLTREFHNIYLQSAKAVFGPDVFSEETQ